MSYYVISEKDGSCLVTENDSGIDDLTEMHNNITRSAQSSIYG